MPANHLANAVGRRKNATARVYLSKGRGEIKINNRDIDDYFPLQNQRSNLKQPLIITDNENKFDLLITASGGGISGQLGACIHGIARALVAFDIANRESLKANGLLTRDSRMVERKKYGKHGARRSHQFSKR